MKKMMCIVAFFIALIGTVQAQSNKKILIAYFSWSGNTREIAKNIQKQTGGDLFEMVVKNPYSTDYNECVKQAQNEQQTNARPAFTAEVKSMETYDVVFVGYPNWWGTMPMVLFTFLEKYDMNGKTVIPFCTHGNGRWGRSVDDLKKLCPNSTVLEGFAVNGSMAKNSEDDVSKWLQKIGITNKK
ncbi:MAG: NAD(P)H-dependent oxidoreductase [Prevotellaceae bacterium]|jgi:flavodoxin|nr:NAD(P)H-dependent oxidoreductase [Prevotellaceae bacterium]